MFIHNKRFKQFETHTSVFVFAVILHVLLDKTIFSTKWHVIISHLYLSLVRKYHKVPQNEIPGEYLGGRSIPILNAVVAISACNMDFLSENVDMIISFIGDVDALLYMLTNQSQLLGCQLLDYSMKAIP